MLGFASELYVVQISGLWVLGTVKQHDSCCYNSTHCSGHTATLDATTQATLVFVPST